MSIYQVHTEIKKPCVNIILIIFYRYYSHHSSLSLSLFIRFLNSIKYSIKNFYIIIIAFVNKNYYKKNKVKRYIISLINNLTQYNIHHTLNMYKNISILGVIKYKRIYSTRKYRLPFRFSQNGQFRHIVVKKKKKKGGAGEQRYDVFRGSFLWRKIKDFE